MNIDSIIPKALPKFPQMLMGIALHDWVRYFTFNVWDRLMGTNHYDCETRFREVTGRAAKSGRSPETAAIETARGVS